MPADDPNGRPLAGEFEGFRSYADDTPRSPEPGEDALRLRRRRSEARPRAPWAPVAAAVALAAALGVSGVLTLGGTSAKQAESNVQRPLPVEVAQIKPPQPPPPSATEPLEVLPEIGDRPTIDLAPEVPMPVRRKPAVAEAPPDPEPPPVERAEPRRPQFAVTGVPAAAAAAAVEPPRPDPCAGASSPAAEMVCRDPELAAADRRMRRAYDAALRAGAPEEMLSLEQSDWREIRELAARRSPRAVASIYRQRTDELWRMADAPWR